MPDVRARMPGDDHWIDLNSYLEEVRSTSPQCAADCRPLTGLLAKLLCSRGHKLGWPYVWGGA